MGCRAFLAILAAFLPTGGDAAEVPTFEIPIDCAVGETCFVQNYVDIDPGPGVRDFACGSLTFDGHEGVDFRVRDLTDVARGVPVLAAARGRVLRVRDGVPDGFPEDAGEERLEGRECGNGLVIDHGGGWRTQYCHLRNGSALVRRGQTVEAEEQIGLVGMSGKAEFPHVHLSIRHEGHVVDPFVGPGAVPGCSGEGRPLWSAAARRALTYRPSGLLNAGFTSLKPTLRGIEEARYRDHLPNRDTNLIFYVRFFGLRDGDRQRLRIRGPDGRIVVETTTLPADKNKAQWMQFIGRRAPDQGWPPGTYRGRFALLRAGTVVLEAMRDLELP